MADTECTFLESYLRDNFGPGTAAHELYRNGIGLSSTKELFHAVRTDQGKWFTLNTIISSRCYVYIWSGKIDHVDAAILDSFVTFLGQEKYTQKAKIDEISATWIGWGLQTDSGGYFCTSLNFAVSNWVPRVSWHVQLSPGKDAKEWNLIKDREEVVEPRQTPAPSRLESGGRCSRWKSGVFPLFHITGWHHRFSRLYGFWKDQIFMQTPRQEVLIIKW